MSALISLFVSIAQAACASPSAPVGAFQYNTSALQFCDGTNWLPLGSTNTGTTCTVAGQIRSTGTDHQYCNGTNWISTLTGTIDGTCSMTGQFTSTGLIPEFCDGTNLKRMTSAVATSNLLLRGENGNGSTTISDSSSHADTLTAFGNAKNSTAQFKFGTGSLYFDASAGTYAGKSSDTNLNLGSGDFTVEMWIRPAASSLTVGLADFRSTSNTAGILIGLTGGKIYIEANSTNVAVDSVAITLNVWTHVAMVRSGNVVTLYKNGAVVATTSNAYALANFNGASITVGTYYNSTATTIYKFNGYIDNLRVIAGTAAYTRAFTPPSDF